jgi:hypothetical protein
MPVIEKDQPVAVRVTLRDMHQDPRKLAEFMGWPFNEELESITIVFSKEARTKQGWARVEQPKGIAETSRRFAALVSELRRNWEKSKHNHLKRPRTWSQFIAECIRENAKASKKSGGKARLVVDDGFRFPPPGKLEITTILWDQFVKRCVREEFGINAATADEAQQLCIGLYPDVFSKYSDGQGAWGKDGWYDEKGNFRACVYNTTEGPSFAESTRKVASARSKLRRAGKVKIDLPMRPPTRKDR